MFLQYLEVDHIYSAVPDKSVFVPLLLSSVGACTIRAVISEYSYFVASF
jgi:hypothetical protein